MTYKYLLFKPDFVLTRISTAPFLYTGFSDLGNIVATTIQCYPLAINGQVFEPGLAYLNYILEPINLYLTREQVRVLAESEKPELESYKKYGSFFFVVHPTTYPKIRL